jgi:hypothetical protein
LNVNSLSANKLVEMSQVCSIVVFTYNVLNWLFRTTIVDRAPVMFKLPIVVLVVFNVSKAPLLSNVKDTARLLLISNDSIDFETTKDPFRALDDRLSVLIVPSGLTEAILLLFNNSVSTLTLATEVMRLLEASKYLRFAMDMLVNLLLLSSTVPNGRLIEMSPSMRLLEKSRYSNPLLGKMGRYP